jgi:hypothetical protein
VWIAAYLTTAVVVAFLTWHMSHHFQSFERPTDAARALWAVMAGAVWPVILLGAAQMLVIHLITLRLRRAPAAHAVPVPVLASDVAARV